MKLKQIAIMSLGIMIILAIGVTGITWITADQIEKNEIIMSEYGVVGISTEWDSYGLVKITSGEQYDIMKEQLEIQKKNGDISRFLISEEKTLNKDGRQEVAVFIKK